MFMMLHAESACSRLTTLACIRLRRSRTTTAYRRSARATNHTSLQYRMPRSHSGFILASTQSCAILPMMTAIPPTCHQSQDYVLQDGTRFSFHPRSRPQRYTRSSGQTLQDSHRGNSQPIMSLQNQAPTVYTLEIEFHNNSARSFGM